MLTKQYTSVAIKKEMLNTLGKLEPNKKIKHLVTEAIVEYIRNRTFSVTSKTSDVGLLNVDLTPALTNQYTPSP